MKQYLLSIYQPDGDAPAPELLASVMRDVTTIVADAKASGAWVFNAGLLPPESATVVRAARGDILVTDGPFAETKEHIGGFMIVRAPDLDAALGWARRLAQALTLPGHEMEGGLPIEVRPLRSEAEH